MKRLCLLLGIIIFLACAPAVTVKMEKFLTNTELIIQSIDKIEIPWNLFRTGERVALVSIETEKTTDFPVNYLIEDRLIKKISEKGTIPVERNDRLIPALILESNSTVPNTDLVSADKIITYRVLDCGIEYKSTIGAALIRTAYTILHIRVEDAKRGNILWLSRVEAKAEDQIPGEMVEKLKGEPLIFYDNEMPNIKGGLK